MTAGYHPELVAEKKKGDNPSTLRGDSDIEQETFSRSTYNEEEQCHEKDGRLHERTYLTHVTQHDVRGQNCSLGDTQKNTHTQAVNETVVRICVFESVAVPVAVERVWSEPVVGAVGSAVPSLAPPPTSPSASAT